MDAADGRVAAALRRRERSRDQILEAAGRLFTERGYRSATVAAVAAAAHVGPATVYNRFGTKAAIVAHLLQSAVADLREAARRDIAAPLACADTVIRHAGRLSAAIASDRPLWSALFDAMQEARRQPPAVPDHDPRVVAPLVQVLWEILKAGQAGGELYPEFDPQRIATDMTWVLGFHALHNSPNSTDTVHAFLYGIAPRDVLSAAPSR